MDSPKIAIRKLCTLESASPHQASDQRNSEEKRTCAIRSLKVPREITSVSKREVKRQRHCLPAPCGSTKSATLRNDQGDTTAVSCSRASTCNRSNTSATSS